MTKKNTFYIVVIPFVSLKSTQNKAPLAIDCVQTLSCFNRILIYLATSDINRVELCALLYLCTCTEIEINIFTKELWLNLQLVWLQRTKLKYTDKIKFDAKTHLCIYVQLRH